jgi:oligopeptide/dipeptide ABC transporter ATP-binding protein
VSTLVDPAATPPAAAKTPLFELRDVKVHFRRGRGRPVRAVDGVDLVWHRGEVLGIVGESGCGKSTLGRALLGLQPITSGEILADGAPLARSGLRALRRRVQMVFQDPYQSLNPRQKVSDLVTEPLGIHHIGSRGSERRAMGVAALDAAGLRPPERFWNRFPHELSGGQRQRVVIASAMVLGPEGLVCDEPVSALDVSVRSQVLQVLVDLKRDRDLGLIFITHDVGLAWTLCDRIAVMYLGRIVEAGTAEQVLQDPQHPYTQSLLSVVPTPVPRDGQKRTILKGELPDASRVPDGCRFHPRCPRVFDRCHSDDPRQLLGADKRSGHGAACWLQEQAPTAGQAPIVSGS